MKGKPFQKKYTIEHTDKGYTIAFYGNLTGQSYATPDQAQSQIENLRKRDLSEQKKKAAQRRKSKTNTDQV